MDSKTYPEWEHPFYKIWCLKGRASKFSFPYCAGQARYRYDSSDLQIIWENKTGRGPFPDWGTWPLSTKQMEDRLRHASGPVQLQFRYIYWFYRDEFQCSTFTFSVMLESALNCHIIGYRIIFKIDFKSLKFFFRYLSPRE